MRKRDSQHDSVATVIENFIAELQRRKVVRVAIVYGAFAWLILQFSDIIIDAFAAPDWVMRVLLLFLVLALPFTLILAWLFDITPSGIKLTADNQPQSDDLIPSILLISKSNEAGTELEDGDSFCKQLSSKLEHLITAYSGAIAGMHAGHCVVQFRDSALAVSCGLAVLRLLQGSERPVSLSIASGHYHAGTLASQAINIAKSINPPLNGSQQLVISTPVYEHELNQKNNPLLKFFEASKCLVNGHELVAFKVKPEAIEHPAVLWRIRDDRKSQANKQTVFRKHRVLLASLLALVVAFSWLYINYLGSGSASMQSLAIMPFRSLDESPESNAIALGLNEELQDHISKLASIQLASSRSTRALANNNMDVPELGEKLNVDNLVEGSTRQLDGKFRITIDLSETETGKLLWSHIYQAGLDDIYSVQEDIIFQLAKQLNIEYQSNLGDIELSNADYGKYIKAIGYFELPNNLLYLSKAEAILRELLNTYPNYAPAEAGLCRLYLIRFASSKASGDYRKGASYCEDAERNTGDNVNVLLSLTDINITNGDWDKAQEYADKGLALEPENLDFLRASARIRQMKNQPELAEDLLLKAIQLEPAYWRNYDMLAMIYMSTGRLEDSIAEFHLAADLMPEEASIFNRMGAVYYQLGNFKAAAKAFEQSVKLQPNMAAFSNLATVYYFSGDYEKARDYNLKATQIEPQNHILWRNLADSETAIPGLFSSAISHYKLATKLADDLLLVTPNDVEALSSQAWCFAQMDQDNQARKKIEKALALGPDDPNVLYEASATYTRLGEEDKARELLQLAIQAGMPRVVIAATPGLNAIYEESSSDNTQKGEIQNE